jgi:hypothetical protein
MSPRPSAFMKYISCVGNASKRLSISPDQASDLVITALCDGTLKSWGINSGVMPRPLSNLPWCRFKYQGVPIRFDAIEIETASFLLWLMPELTRGDVSPNSVKLGGNGDNIQSAVPPDPTPASRDTSGVELPSRSVPVAYVRKCIHAIHEAAVSQGVKPPNVNEIGKEVNKLLACKGARVSDASVKRLSQEPEFKRYHGAVGRKTLLRPLEDLQITKSMLP